MKRTEDEDKKKVIYIISLIYTHIIHARTIYTTLYDRELNQNQETQEN